MPMQGSRGRAGAAAVVLGLLVGGCTPEPSPERTSTPATVAPSSPTPAPSTVPTPDAPVPPVEMFERSTAGAIAAAAYYVTSLYPYAYVSGDLDELRAMSDADCSFCNTVISDVEEIVRLDQTDSGAPVALQASRGGDPSGDDSYASVWLTAEQGASERRDMNGVVITQDPGGVYDFFLVLEWRDRWVVRGIEIEESL